MASHRHQMLSVRSHLACKLAPYNLAIATIARTYRLESIDLPKLMQKENIEPERIWAEDRVHLSPTGNRIYGKLVFDQLRKSLR